MSRSGGDGEDERVVWPDHVGVAGIRAHAASASAAQRLGSDAGDAVAAWARDPSGSFPYGVILDHYQSVGRVAASAGLVCDLGRLRTVEARRAQGFVTELSVWLANLTDHADGDYHTYAGLHLHEALIDSKEHGGPEYTADLLTLALLVDLLRFEAQTLAWHPTREQRARTGAVINALHRIGQLAPEARYAAPGVSVARESARRGADGDLASLALKAAAQARIPDAVAAVIDRTMVPATVLHDEHMFLRSIQLFECLYLRAARSLGQAATALLAGDTAAALAALEETATRFDGASALYRVVTTMPPPTFAIIRKYTSGRSAIQSRTFRQVESTAAPTPGVDDGADRGEAVLQTAFLQARRTMAADTAEAFLAAMVRVDERWCAMKRSHWGITLKTIGRARGTGGTDGADYLYQTSLRPLFPALVAAAPAGLDESSGP
jgi:tryptophan 2,3-dioxygenase